MSLGQTWNLTSTMKAVLIEGVLTISTTKDAEAMPDYEVTFNASTGQFERNCPWSNRDVSSVVIEDKITTIGSYSFYFCLNIKSITIPNSVTIIRDMAFYRCAALTSVTIPNSVTTIGNSAFGDCLALTSVAISNSVTTIGNWAFQRCALTSITNPNSVTTIGIAAYSGNAFTSVTIPSSVTDIGGGSFSNCSELRAINVDEKNTFYLSDEGVLYNKDKTVLLAFPAAKWAETFDIPTSVTTIGYIAFAGCQYLTSVTIPNSVTNLGSDAFLGCTALKDVKVEWTTPLSISDEIFGTGTTIGRIDKSTVTLHVPAGTKALYQAAPVWKDFGTIVEYNPTNTESIENPTLKAYASNSILTISGLQTGKPVSIYSVSGQLVYSGIAKAETEQIPLNANGVYIVTSKNQTIKVAIK